MLESCVDSLCSARAAVAGGADRLELCSALCVGGLTPYGELLYAIRQETDIPIRCLMRPRPGDFLYTREEVDLLVAQIAALRSRGADGFVIGALQKDGSLDVETMARLIEACGDTGITLHRCIDVSCNIEETYLVAGRLGVDTVLTSGGQANCLAGLPKIQKLLTLQEENHGPEVLIGAGVNAQVIRTFREKCPPSRAFHMSGKKNIDSQMVFRQEGIPMGLPGLPEWEIPQTDEWLVRQAKAELK